jgi:hypothetical protein
MSTSSEPQIDKSEILESGQICPVFHPDHNCLFQAEVWAYRHAILRRYAQRTELYENIGSESNLKDGASQVQRRQSQRGSVYARS